VVFYSGMHILKQMNIQNLLCATTKNNYENTIQSTNTLTSADDTGDDKKHKGSETFLNCYRILINDIH
jgi:hypothetical protein